ncbi:aldo/keto reductase [Solihabitans fulvus]|uniref:Aldo/keto reductase n=1 Tax=Solihabitans fulvus TaxID=1892852 RepID=A0A5B2WWX8_9PSEU|nr:aldo/keto reductase family protein [Solihabitans fulvus]KAA2254956.1 aldo/keto reductase [Solihabitans fulvus]
MEHRRLGNSGLSVSEIAYGNWLTHGGQVEEDVAVKCVRAAIEAGITTFDSADIYALGAAERVLGRALSGLRRESFELLSKVYFPVGDGPNDRGLGRKHIMESINQSLRRLGTDYLDLYQAHRFDPSVRLEETMLAFADIVRAGKALYIGVSEWTADQLDRAHQLAAELNVPLVSNQPQYSMLWRVIEQQVVPTAKRLGIGQLVFSPVTQGVLTGKYLPATPVPAGSRATDERGGRFISRAMSDTLLATVQRLRPIAADAGLSMAQLAVAWVLQNDNVASAIIGASRPEQVSHNTVASGVRLDGELLARIDDVLGDLVERDPAKTGRPDDVQPAWRRENVDG